MADTRASNLISVIVPVFNGSSFLSRALGSIQEQTYKNFEVIVVDDASTDNSAAIINNFCESDSRFRILRLTNNSGGGVARNAGLAAAKGRYVAFLDCDDYWLPNKLKLQLDVLEKNAHVALVCSGFFSMYADGTFKKIIPPEQIRVKRLQFTNDICCSSVMVDLDRTGHLVFPNIRYRQDWGLWLKIFEKHPMALCISEPLLVYRNYSGISATKARVIIKQWIFFRDNCRYGVIKSVVYFLFYAINGIVKKNRLFRKNKAK